MPSTASTPDADPDHDHWRDIRAAVDKLRIILGVASHRLDADPASAAHHLGEVARYCGLAQDAVLRRIEHPEVAMTPAGSMASTVT